MNNILIGNGINIQFDNINYTTKNIIIRLLSELDSPEFPVDYIVDDPLLLKCYIGKLFLFARDMIDGKFDDSVNCSAEIKALKDFKERYKDRKKSLTIPDIGFEDYYLIHDLVSHKFGTVNPEQYVVRESMKMAYFHSIYNNGRINLLYRNYSKNFIDYLLSFDNIFTTNYDSNLESATGKEIYHIHGQFDKLSEVYNPDSFRNRLNDNPIEGIPNDPAYTYLHSTAVSTYCGDYKQYQLKQNSVANKAVEKMAKGYTEMEAIHNDVDSWANVDNQLVVNLGDAIKLKVANPEIRFQEDYSLDRFGNMQGELTILGLSPYNDYHLFELICDSNISNCTYYYFDESECPRIEMLLNKLQSQNMLMFKSVKTFWEGM